MNDKYTKGPWVYDYGMVYTASGIPIAKADRDTPQTRPTERDANMRAVAILPELIDACNGLLDYRKRNTANFQLEKCDDYLALIAGLIARANG